MKPELKIKILSWAVVALALLNLSTVAGIYYYLHTDQISEDNIRLEMNFVQMSGRDFRDSLKLSPQQMDEFRPINNKFRRSARDFKISLDKARDEMFIELNKDNPDLEICNKLSAEMGRLHKDLKEITCLYYLDVKQLCDTEQKKKLEKLFAPVFTSEYGFGFGRGQGQFRRGNGRVN